MTTSVNSGIKIDGKIVTDREQVESEIIHFFNALFNGHHGSDLVDKGVPFVPDWRHLDSLLSGVGEITDTERSHLVSAVRKDEMDFVIKNCPGMKSPGLDGLTYEFYSKVWM